MKILLLGKNGQLGWELQRSLAPLGDVIALDRKSQAYCGDLSKLQGLEETVQHIKPDIIVNAAAYTAVDKAESEPELALLINAGAPAILAQQASLSGALLIHYSTDYVFDGSGTRAWQETDLPAPLNIYGASKLAGEQAIQSSGCKHLIFRTSWVYATRGHNFAKTILRLAQERDSLTVINDQTGAPTGADLLADITAHTIGKVLLTPELCGLYHLVASGEATWHGFASLVVDTAQRLGVNLKTTTDALAPIPTSAFPSTARRPGNSRLNTHKFQSKFFLTLPNWQVGVTRMIAEMIEK